MGKQLLTQIVPAIQKMSWPAAPQATALGRKTYEVGLDQVDAYRGDPKVLAAALKTFRGGDSLPYAYAGVAYTLIAAAQEADGSYDQAGLDEAFRWLEIGFADRFPEMAFVKVHPLLFELRGDPRFTDLVRRIGL